MGAVLVIDDELAPPLVAPVRATLRQRGFAVVERLAGLSTAIEFLQALGVVLPQYDAAISGCCTAGRDTAIAVATSRDSSSLSGRTRT